MLFFIYKTKNKINGKYYIGKHTTDDLDDGYLGSGTILKRAVRKYGGENFEREILMFCENEEELNKKEREIVNQKLLDDPLSYNLKLGGEGGFDYVNSVYWTPDKMQKSARKKWEKIKNDPELLLKFKNSISVGLKKYFDTHNSWWIGKTHTADTKRKIHEAKVGKFAGKDNHNYGKKWWRDPVDNTKRGLFNDGDKIPDGWIVGRGVTEKEKEYTATHKKIVIIKDGIRKLVAVPRNNIQIPDGWILCEKKRKIKKRRIVLSEEDKQRKKQERDMILLEKKERSKRRIIEMYDFYMKNGYDKLLEVYDVTYPIDYFMKKVKKILPDAVFLQPEKKNPRVWVCKDGVAKYVIKEKVNQFLDSGWVIGRLNGTWKKRLT